MIPQCFNYCNFVINLISALASIFPYFSLEIIKIICLFIFPNELYINFFRIQKNADVVFISIVLNLTVNLEQFISLQFSNILLDH